MLICSDFHLAFASDFRVTSPTVGMEPSVTLPGISPRHSTRAGCKAIVASNSCIGCCLLLSINPIPASTIAFKPVITISPSSAVRSVLS